MASKYKRSAKTIAQQHGPRKYWGKKGDRSDPVTKWESKRKLTEADFEGWKIGHDYNRGVSQRFTGAKEGKLATKKKDKKWIQAASASIKKRGTEGVCTGPKFGGPTCPPGSKRYNLAKVFKGMAKKKKKAAWGSMIHAKTSKYIQRAKDRHPPLSEKDRIQEAYERAQKNKGTDRITTKDLKKDDSWKYKTGPIRIDKRFMFNKRFLKKDPRMLRQGGMLKAQHGVHTQVRSALAKGNLPGITKGTKGTTGMAKFVKGFKNILGVLPAGAASKWSKIPKASQLKTLAKTGGRRSLALAGGPIGLGMYAGTMGAKHLVTKAFDPYRDKATGKISKKGHETLAAAARSREALMAKRNKARNAKTGTMVRAAQGIEVLGKQQVPFKIEPAGANLAEQRQGRKGAAVTGFNFKGVF